MFLTVSKSRCRMNVSERKASSLHEAVHRKSVKELETLLAQGSCNTECINEDGKTALVCAVEKDFEAGVHSLLAKGASVNVADQCGATPLQYALMNTNKGLVESLILKGANVHYADNRGSTPLHTAVRVECETGVSLLLKAGAKVNVKDIHENTPLHLSGSDAVVEILLAGGAEINCKRDDGRTVLHLAVIKCQLPMVKILLKNGADVNIQDKFRETPIFWALRRRYKEDINDLSDSYYIIEQLLDWGSSLYTITINKETPLSFALRTNCTKIHVQKYTVKLKCANLPFDTNLDVAASEFSSYQLECLRELETIKSTKFGRHSMYCVFSKCTCYLSNMEMEQAIWSPDLESDFPIYGSLLLATFVKAKKRRDLLDSAQHSLTVLLQASKPVIFLPDEIIENILSFINNDDLMILIRNLSVIDIV